MKETKPRTPDNATNLIYDNLYSPETQKNGKYYSTISDNRRNHTPGNAGRSASIPSEISAFTDISFNIFQHLAIYKNYRKKIKLNIKETILQKEKGRR